jgi:arylsulfatase A-like enzyme
MGRLQQSSHRIKGYFPLGINGGFLAGIFIGGFESCLLWFQSSFSLSKLFLYGICLYSIFCLVIGGFLALAWGFFEGVKGRGFRPPKEVFSFVTAIITALGLGIIGRFVVLRDIFHENISPFSLYWFAVHIAIILGTISIFFMFQKALSFLLKLPLVGLMLKKGLGFLGGICAILLLLGLRSEKQTISKPAYKSKATFEERPNIILIMVDALRRDAVGIYTDSDNSFTPHLDSLAKDGVVFLEAYTPCSWTRPAVASVFSSQYPSSHGTIYKANPLPNKIETLAEILSQHGYWTSAMVTNYNISSFFNFHQGFREYRFLEPSRYLGATDIETKFALYNFLRLFIERFILKGLRPERYYQNSKGLTKEAIKWIKNRPSDPFFLFLQYMDPHDPYFDHPYNGKGIARVKTPNPPKDKLTEIKTWYKKEVEFFDKHLGYLLNTLKQEGIYKEALIILFADHGEEFLDHGGWWHGTTLYQELIHIPLILKPPLGSKTIYKKNLVSLIDIPPTILRFAQIKVPSSFQGQDLFDKERRFILAEEDHQGNIIKALIIKDKKRKEKLILTNKSNPRRLPRVQLFNLDMDPKEKKNLASQNRQRVIILSQMLQRIWGKIKKQDLSISKVTLDKEAKERLRSLGYVE